MPPTPPRKIIISASRRTDIPAFYMPWFMDRIERGTFEVENPFNGRITKVPATPDAVHTIVFWSKDFGPFLQGGYGEELTRRGYHLFFNFTINSDCPDLEPQVPPLDARLNQLEKLCTSFPPQSILWRFDPICFYETPDGTKDNLGGFALIAAAASRLGIQRCITSFLDLYPKIRRRTERRSALSFVSLPLERQRDILLKLQSQLGPLGMQLFTCCEKTLLETLPSAAGILPSACIPSHLISEIFGGSVSLRKDPGQRTGAGCGCSISSDIGSYKDHPCHHNCLFCYANPAAYQKNEPRRRKPDESTPQ